MRVDAVPFVHADLEVWRDPFEGITYMHEPTGLLVSGAVDDLWQTPSGEIIVVDYKATSKEGKIESLKDSSWEEQYTRQIGVYQWLLRQNGFTVSNTGYFVYANALQTEERFDNTLIFDTTLIPCEGDDSWIDQTLHDIHACLESTTYPAVGDRCEYCPYREACGKKLQTLHKNHG